MADRYFSPHEVEALIPELTRLIEAVQSAQALAAEAQERLQGEQQRLTMAGGAVLDRAAWGEATRTLERERKRLEGSVTRIGEMGGVIKDAGMGLVDFPHLRDGEVVNLCWRLGETVIRYWHGMNEGFAARKPL